MYPSITLPSGGSGCPGYRTPRPYSLPAPTVLVFAVQPCVLLPGYAPLYIIAGCADSCVRWWHAVTLCRFWKNQPWWYAIDPVCSALNIVPVLYSALPLPPPPACHARFYHPLWFNPVPITAGRVVNVPALPVLCLWTGLGHGLHTPQTPTQLFPLLFTGSVQVVHWTIGWLTHALPTLWW